MLEGLAALRSRGLLVVLINLASAIASSG